MERKTEKCIEYKPLKIRCVSGEPSVSMDNVQSIPLFNPDNLEICGYSIDEASGWYLHNKSSWLYNDEDKVYFDSSTSQLYTFDESGLSLVELNTQQDKFIHDYGSECDNYKYKNEDKVISYELDCVTSPKDDESDIYLELDNDIIAGSNVRVNKLINETECEDRFITKLKLPIEVVNSTSEALCFCSAVFDGHAGSKCVDYVYNNLLTNVLSVYSQEMCRNNVNIPGHIPEIGVNEISKSNLSNESCSQEIKALCKGLEKGFQITNNNYLAIARKRQYFDGTTASVCLIYGPDPVDGELKLILANCGDSRIILGRLNTNGDVENVVAHRLTTDHRPFITRERQRIEKLGGYIKNCDGIWKMFPRTKILGDKQNNKPNSISVSRSIGDLHMKEPTLLSTWEPDIRIESVDMDRDLFLVLLTNGVSEFLSDEDIVKITKENYSKNPNEIAELITKAAENNGSKDDKTAVVLLFQWSINRQIEGTCREYK
ncbi:protein phosphatase 2C [Cryptosporidium andersoni]|uniref:Protein phosphatase 2C n=1 Tax=Cryptosporidium andersoni TaxID=117008 RepID=A0A1J4MEH9_9CRYT|nr:protein phosphatase 2C [Cryptosporidium andersoni]